MSWPQLAHTFLPADGTELAVEVGEHTDGVDGLLLLLAGDERVSSRSMLDRCDSPSECGCKEGGKAQSDPRTRTQHITVHAARTSQSPFYTKIDDNKRNQRKG